MCGIVGSFSMANIAIGFEHVRQRGTKGYSLSALDTHGALIATRAYDASIVSVESAMQEVQALAADIKRPYYVLHVQSPTGLISSPHPAVADMGITPANVLYLWHNGMLNSKEYRAAESPEWDTKLFARDIVSRGVSRALGEFEGTFACIAAIPGDGIVCFRNVMSPLFYSLDGTLCSTSRFAGSVALQPNTVYRLQLFTDGAPGLQVQSFFQNNYNPLGL